MYNNIFGLKPYQKFVIRTDEGKQSCTMFFTQNGVLHCDDCDWEFLPKLICGMQRLSRMKQNTPRKKLNGQTCLFRFLVKPPKSGK